MSKRKSSTSTGFGGGHHRSIKSLRHEPHQLTRDDLNEYMWINILDRLDVESILHLTDACSFLDGIIRPYIQKKFKRLYFDEDKDTSYWSAILDKMNTHQHFEALNFPRCTFKTLNFLTDFIARGFTVGAISFIGKTEHRRDLLKQLYTINNFCSIESLLRVLSNSKTASEKLTSLQCPTHGAGFFYQIIGKFEKLEKLEILMNHAYSELPYIHNASLHFDFPLMHTLKLDSACVCYHHPENDFNVEIKGLRNLLESVPNLNVLHLEFGINELAMEDIFQTVPMLEELAVGIAFDVMKPFTRLRTFIELPVSRQYSKKFDFGNVKDTLSNITLSRHTEI